MKKDKHPKNSKDQPHGNWVIYFDNGRIDFKGKYINNELTGLCESYYSDGDIDFKGYFINNKPVGVHIEGDYENELINGHWRINKIFYIQ